MILPVSSAIVRLLKQIYCDPLRGQLPENLALLEFVKARHAQALDPQLYFFRDAHGHEVDFIFHRGRTLIPIEVRSAKTFHAEYLKGIRFFQELVRDRAPQGYLIGVVALMRAHPPKDQAFKSTCTDYRLFPKRLHSRHLDDLCNNAYLIYGGSQEERLGSTRLLPFEKAHQVVTGS